jgi:hypothetical protein
VIYTINKVTATQQYIWAIGTTAATITHVNAQGVNDTAVAITFASNYATSTLSVYTLNDCGVSSSRTLNIVRVAPSTPSLISGPTNVCENIGSTGQTATYSIPVVANADSYSWTLPAGCTNITGQGTTSISFKYPAGFTGGTVSVVATNGCGTSSARSLTVTRLLPAMPGNIDVINISGCPNRVFTYSISAVPANATSLLWFVPTGATLVSGQGTTSITVSYPSSVIDGIVSVQAVSNCGTSGLKSVYVKLAPCPAGPVAPLKNVAGTLEETPLDVKVYPNPTTNVFNVQVKPATVGGTSSTESIKVRIMDVQGRTLREVRTSAYQTINLGAELRPGAYMIEVRQGNSVRTTRVIKY